MVRSCSARWIDAYDALVAVDFPDAITGGLRRTVDALRAVLERTRSDVTITVLQSRLAAGDRIVLDAACLIVVDGTTSADRRHGAGSTPRCGGLIGVALVRGTGRPSSGFGPGQAQR